MSCRRGKNWVAPFVLLEAIPSGRVIIPTTIIPVFALTLLRKAGKS
jgi:hypothetical protein